MMDELFTLDEIIVAINAAIQDAQNVLIYANDFNDLFIYNARIIAYAEETQQPDKLNLRSYLSEKVGDNAYKFIGLRYAMRNMRLWRNAAITTILNGFNIFETSVDDLTDEERIDRSSEFYAYFHGLVEHQEAEVWSILSNRPVKHL